MQKISKRTAKRIIAIILCIVMIVTSLPFALAAGAGTYDPIPYFHEDGQKDPETAAYKNDNGGVTVNFPAAKARSGKKIDGYFLELLDLGSYKTEHNFDVPANRRLSKWVDVNTLKGVDFSIEFKKADIESVFPKGLDPENRYSVTIIAVDNAGWFSDPIYAAVYNVPDPNYVFTMEPFQPLTENQTAVREMMKFEKESQWNKGSLVDKSRLSGTGVIIAGAKEEAGAIDPVSPYRRDTASAQFRITEANSQATIDTCWSRETYNAKGAEEVWFWLDLTQVDLTGVSFRLNSNQKRWFEWDDTNQSFGEEDHWATLVYSTEGYSKYNANSATEPGCVYVQQSGGTWKRFRLTLTVKFRSVDSEVMFVYRLSSFALWKTLMFP